MEVREYIKKNRKSILAARLKSKFGENSRKQIHTGSGLLSPYTKSSNLYKTLEQTGSNSWIVGGRAGQRASQGYHFAVYKK